MKRMKFGTLAATSILMLIGLTGCGNAHHTSKAPQQNPQAISSYQQAVKPVVLDLANHLKNAEDVLLSYQSQNVSYSTFQSKYVEQVKAEQQDANKLASITAQKGAKVYQSQFLSLVKSEVKMSKDQGSSFTETGTDKAKVQQVKQELSQFQNEFQSFIATYPNSNLKG